MKHKLILPLLALMLCFAGCQNAPAPTTEPSTEPSETQHLHVYVEDVIPPTCTENGYSVFTCDCGDTYQDKVTESLGGHVYTPEVVEPTCTEGGYTIYTCVCGDTYTDDETDPTGHTYTEEVTDATCDAGGYTTYTCACGDTYTGNETAALGHLYTTDVVPPTDTEQGYTQFTCSRCGSSYKGEFISAGEVAGNEFFDDAVFIGDSVTMALRNYCVEYGALGNVKFLVRGSYSAAHAVNNTMYMQYQGMEMTLQDAVAASGAKKLFILLGMNDIALHGIDTTIANWGTLISNIRAKCPDVTIYIESGTPIYTAGQVGGLNNENMDAYNLRLREFAAANGCYYIDVATPMKDETNGLAARYCSDAYVHLTYAACELWITIVKGFVGA